MSAVESRVCVRRSSSSRAPVAWEARTPGPSARTAASRPASPRTYARRSCGAPTVRRTSPRWRPLAGRRRDVHAPVDSDECPLPGAGNFNPPAKSTTLRLNRSSFATATLSTSRHVTALRRGADPIECGLQLRTGERLDTQNGQGFAGVVEAEAGVDDAIQQGT